MSFWDFLGDNSYQVDAQAAEDKLKTAYPYILQDGEKIEMAFKGRGGMGRDKEFLTSHRILIKDGKGFGSKRRNYESIPYQSIQAFSIETAGNLDGDAELNVWGTGCGKVTLQFSAEHVNVFSIQQYMNNKIYSHRKPGKVTDHGDNGDPVFNYQKPPTTMDNLLNWIGDDAVRVDTAVIQAKFRTEFPVLLPNEVVELAYRSGRDYCILTPYRYFEVDVKGFFGKKIEFFSIHWECISAFAVETAGSFERDSDFTLHTNIPDFGLRHIRQDLRKGKADIFQVQTAIANKILGMDPAETSVAPNVNSYQGHVDQGAGLFEWGGSNARPLDATVVNKVLRTSPPLLQSDEVVEMAFRGRRDMVVFTTKRIIDIDVKGLSGRKIEYTSIPYSCILAFAVKSAGKHFDLDCEVTIWTDIMHKPNGGEDDPPEPEMSVLEWDFNKDHVDILAMKRYLNHRLLGTKPGTAVPTGLVSAAPTEQGFERFLSKWGGDQRAIDARELDVVLHTNVHVLMDGENVVMAFQAGRDMTVFTNKRILIMDVQGWSGKKVEYTSVPYNKIRAFAAESAGDWDRDSEIDIYTGCHWIPKLELDFRKGKADIISIQKFLAAIILGNAQDAAKFVNTSGTQALKVNHPAGYNSFTDWIIENSVEENADLIDGQLHSNPPILLSDEKAEKVYREGRDLWVYTNKRVLIVDVKGFSGKKVKYKSIPMEWCASFDVETAGHLDVDAELHIHTFIPWMKKVEQSLLVKRGNIFDLHRLMGDKLLEKKMILSEHHDEPEIVLPPFS